MYQRSLLLLCCLMLAACSNTPTTLAPPPDADAAPLDDWEQIVADARGKTVNWYMWGGSESINNYVDRFYGTALQERYGITLNRVPVSDAVLAVDQLLSEKEAGIDPGSIDLIWINGENFASLKQAEMLYGGWNQKLPNSILVDYTNPALIYDFGVPIEDLESPWSSAQFQFIYDSARTDPADLPRSYAALLEYACANQGRFTYIAPGPGAFQGTRFVKGALFELSGGAEQWRSFDQARWEQWSPQLWAYLNELKPCLWRAGRAYPATEYELHGLFANREVDYSITQSVTGAGALIAEGAVPETARAFVFDNYMIGDYNYVAIPRNAPNRAAALVLANLLLEPEFQAAQILPENGFGLGYGIDIRKVTDEQDRATLEAALNRLGPAATPPAALLAALVPDAAPEYQSLIEEGWRENVLIGN